MSAFAHPSGLADFIFPEQLSSRIGISVQTLARWRSEGQGPSYYKIGGKRIAYRISTVEAWLEANRHAVTNSVSMPPG